MRCWHWLFCQNKESAHLKIQATHLLAIKPYASNLRTLSVLSHSTTNLHGVFHLKRPWCWERLRARGERDDRGWDSWMASPCQWTRVWVDSGTWWWTGRPGMWQFMGWQRVEHDWMTELKDYTHRKHLVQWQAHRKRVTNVSDEEEKRREKEKESLGLVSTNCCI